jgi:hypothetical protein
VKEQEQEQKQKQEQEQKQKQEQRKWKGGDYGLRLFCCGAILKDKAVDLKARVMDS